MICYATLQLSAKSCFGFSAFLTELYETIKLRDVELQAVTDEWAYFKAQYHCQFNYDNECVLYSLVNHKETRYLILRK